MNDIEDEDKILRDKIEGSAFDYDEAYWERAKQMLRSGNKRRLIWWRFSVATLLFLFIAGGTFYLLNNKNVVVVKSPVNSNTNNKVEVNKEQDRASGSKTFSENNNSDNPVNNSELTNNGSDTTTSIESNTESSVKNETPSYKLAGANKINGSVQKTKGNKQNKTLTSAIGIQNANSESETGIILSLSKSSVTGDNNDASNIQPIANRLTTEQIDSLNGKSINSIANPESPLKGDIADSSFRKYLQRVSFKRKQYISINAGANFNKTIRVTGNQTFAIGASPYAGISYSRAIDEKNKKLIEIGLQVCSYNNVQSQDVVHHSNYYSFGYGKADVINPVPIQSITDSTFTLQQKSLFIIQLPVSLNCSINERSSFNAGIGLSYIFNVLSNITGFDGSAEKAFDYTQGFKPFSAFIQAGYSYNITEKWLLHLNLQQGLTNMIDNSFLDTGRNYFSTNIQLGLSYRFAIHSKINPHVEK